MLENDNWLLVKELVVVGFVVGFFCCLVFLICLLGRWGGGGGGFSAKGKSENRGREGPVFLILLKFSYFVS